MENGKWKMEVVWHGISKKLIANGQEPIHNS